MKVGALWHVAETAGRKQASEFACEEAQMLQMQPGLFDRK